MNMGQGLSSVPCSFCKGTRGMIETFWNDLKLWARKPYDPNGDVGDWFLFIGLLLTIIFLWSRVIRLILREI